MSNSSDDDMQTEGKGWPKKKPYAQQILQTMGRRKGIQGADSKK